MEFISHSQQETINFAKKYAIKLKGGDIVLLCGNLGAGKTHFAQGIADGLGVKQHVASPTFTIMNIYKLSKNPEIKFLTHIDAYRLNSFTDLKNIGLDDYLGVYDTITLIEWADKFSQDFPLTSKKIQIKNSGENERKIIF